MAEKPADFDGKQIVLDILNKLTPEDKVRLLQAKDDWTLNGLPEFGIPDVFLTDGPHGVRVMINNMTDVLPSTTIPTESTLSASWDPELVEEVGSAIGQECQYYKVGILLGPGANAKRSPLGGRNFEYYSEDPYLSGKLAAAMIRGVQCSGVGTSLKHYVGNDQETRRFTMDATIDERTLRELLLPPFEIAIKEGDPWTIMGAYPKISGQHVCENRYLLKTILRDEFGYEGIMLSDWGATVNKVASHKNGLDLETGSYARMDELLNAVRAGEISEEEIDEHVTRVLALLLKTQQGSHDVKVDWNVHHALAKRAALESIVLLKNEANILPLKVGVKIAVVGEFARNPRYGGGGSSGTKPQKLDIPFDCICGYSDAVYAPGFDSEEQSSRLIEEACQVAQSAKTVIVFVGTTEATESEGSDRKHILISESQIALVRAVAAVNPNLILCNSSGSAVDLHELEPLAKAIVHLGLAGEAGGSALADILFGAASPSGKLTETFPVCLENTPAFPFYPGTDDAVAYHEGLLQGYRYYDTKRIRPLYPFGYGKSYTTFAYSNLHLSSNVLHNGEFLEVSVDVTNTGNMAGAEIIQIYVSDPQSYLIRPSKELKGFSRVFLKPGETKTVTVFLDERAFAYFVPHMGRFAVESGIFRILAAASSDDIRLEGDIYFESSDDVRRPLTLDNTLAEFYTDDRYRKAMGEVFRELNITEENPLFPIFSGTPLKNMPAFLSYLNIPNEVAVSLQEHVIGAFC